MWITSWNIRGCNSPLKIRLLKRKIETEKSVIVFLQETKCLEVDLKAIGKKVWLNSVVVSIDAKGAARGIGIIWNTREVALTGFLASQFFLSTYF